MTMQSTPTNEKRPGDQPLSFATHADLDAWLVVHHASRREVWVRIFKKSSGTPSVTWNDCVVASLAWGWIDGHKKSLDTVSFLQRLTPRRAASNWSRRNCEHAERLIAEGRMHPAGQSHVDAARRDGRWAQAYAGSADMVIPDDFMVALAANSAARAFFDSLNRSNLYAIYHRIQTAKRPDTRQRRIVAIVAQLAAGKPFH